jgi:ribosomal-protein-alanine N-acetyltransferase
LSEGATIPEGDIPGQTGAFKFTIRRMKLEDVEQVFAIDQISFSLPWTERSYRFEISENPHSHLWVAVPEDAKDQILGMIVVWLIVDEAHIGSVAVHPDYRRLGIGEALIAHALLELIPLGAVQAMLEVRRSNLAAQALYHKFGFSVAAIRPRYYRDNNEDALLMNLSPLDAGRLRHPTGQ